MKAVFVGLLISVLMIGCYYDDDYQSRTISLEIQDAVTFDNLGPYRVGDTVLFDIGFSRYLPEDGFTTLLDVYETTKSEQFFYYNFGLNRYSQFTNRYELIAVPLENIICPDGKDEITKAVELNQAKDFYSASVGIILVEPGDFQLNFDFLDFYSQNPDNGVDLWIRHSFSGEDAINAEFEVVE